MASGGEVPTPEFKQGDSLQYGDAAQANALLGLVPPVQDGSNDFQPKGPSDQFLVAQTNRPGEPVTAGAPMGAGPNIVSGNYATDDQVVQQTAASLAAAPVSADTKAWLDRAQQEVG